MKRPFIALLAGAALLVAPLTVSSAQAQLNRRPAGFSRSQPALMQALDLSTQQKVQLAQLMKQLQNQVQAVLTAEQKSQLQTALQNGSNLSDAIAAVDLSDAQKTEIRNLVKASRNQFANLLTPEQKQQLRQAMLSRLQQRQ